MAEILLSQVTPATLKEFGLTTKRDQDPFWECVQKIVDDDTKDEYWPKALELLGRYSERVKFDRLVPSVMHKQQMEAIEQSRQEHSKAIAQSTKEITEAIKQMDTQMSATLQGLGDKMDDASVVNKTGFSNLQQTLATTNLLLQQLIEKQAGKTQTDPAAAASVEDVHVKSEPLEMEEDRKSNASMHSTPQASPKSSPVRTNVKMTQAVEQPPVAVASEVESNHVAGAVTNTVNTTGTTPTTTIKDSGNAKLPDTKLASNVDDSSFRSITTVNNAIASTTMVNIPTATVAMSSGMTAQSVPFAYPSGSFAYATSGDSSLLPLFPVTPAVVTSLITAGTQTATTHSQVDRVPSDYNPMIPPPWGLLSHNMISNHNNAPNDGKSCWNTPFPGGGDGYNVGNRWRGGYDPGRGDYLDHHDPAGNQQRHVGRGVDGNAPNGHRHRDRDRNVHRNRQEQPRIPFPKFPEFDGSGSWKSFIASFGKVCMHYDFGEQDMVEWLHLCLRGKAQSYVTSLPYEVQHNYDDLVRQLEQRFEPCSTQVALSLLHQAVQYEGESLCEFADRIRELAQQASQPENGELSSSLLVHIFLRGCLDKQAALQAFLVEHRNLEQAVSYMKMISSSKNVLFGRSKVRQVMFSDREPTVMEGKVDMDGNPQYMTPPGIQRVARFPSNKSLSPSKGRTQAFRGTFGEEFVSSTIDKRFAAMDERIRANKGAVKELRSEFRESLNELRSGQRKGVEVQQKNTEALDEIRSTLRQLVPDSKSGLTNSPRNCFRCGKEGHFRKDCLMEIPSLADSPNKSTF